MGKELILTLKTRPEILLTSACAIVFNAALTEITCLYGIITIYGELHRV